MVGHVADDDAWVEQQRRLLGPTARPRPEGYSWRPGLGLWGPQAVDPELFELRRRIETLCDAVRQRLRDGEAASARDVDCYQSLALYLLYCNVGETMDRAIDEVMRSPVESDGGTGRQRRALPGVKPMWEQFRRASRSE